MADLTQIGTTAPLIAGAVMLIAVVMCVGALRALQRIWPIEADMLAK